MITEQLTHKIHKAILQHDNRTTNTYYDTTIHKAISQHDNRATNTYDTLILLIHKAISQHDNNRIIHLYILIDWCMITEQQTHTAIT